MSFDDRLKWLARLSVVVLVGSAVILLLDFLGFPVFDEHP